jgi:hypothetical protein
VLAVWLAGCVQVGLGGARKNVLRFMPPMCLNEGDVNHFMDTLTATMGRFSRPRAGARPAAGGVVAVAAASKL